jgi:hypothetical protein
VQAAREKLTSLEIIAPFGGVVVDNPLKVGEIVTPRRNCQTGRPDDLAVGNNQLKESVIQQSANRHAGYLCSSRRGLPGLELKGEVERLKIIERKVYGDVYYTAYIQLLETDPRLLWNMTAEVYFDTTTSG